MGNVEGGEKGVLFTFFESREVSINYFWVYGVVAGVVFLPSGDDWLHVK